MFSLDAEMDVYEIYPNVSKFVFVFVFFAQDLFWAKKVLGTRDKDKEQTQTSLSRDFSGLTVHRKLLRKDKYVCLCLLCGYNIQLCKRQRQT